MRRRLLQAGAAGWAVFLVAGCAVRPEPEGRRNAVSGPWRGRLALRLDTQPPQSFHATFELSGNPLAGTLTLSTPLGTTAAVLTWSPQASALRTGTDTREFDSLAALMQQTLGADVPVDALFAWLAGDAVTTAGWQADLSQRSQGRIGARRDAPLPAVELRLVLEP